MHEKETEKRLSIRAGYEAKFHQTQERMKAGKDWEKEV